MRAKAGESEVASAAGPGLADAFDFACVDLALCDPSYTIHARSCLISRRRPVSAGANFTQNAPLVQCRFRGPVMMTFSSLLRPRLMTTWISRQGLARWGVGAVLGVLLGTASAGKPYSYFVTGDADAQVAALKPSSTSSLVLMGGGPDVDEAFRWMIARAGIKPGTGGRFVVLRATGTEAYDPYIYYSDAALTTSTSVAEQWVGGASLGLSSVETLVIPSVAAANDAFVNSVVSKANAVFIAGGDQSDYINFWKGTKLDQTLQGLMAANVPVGGTSAGLAVLGQVDFAALRGSVTTTQALADPFNKYMTLDPSPLSPTGGFLAPPALASTILDAHLDSRDRMGRLITFVARLVAVNSNTGCPGGILASGTSSTAARGIGVDVETALLVQGNKGPHGFTARRVTNPSTMTESAVYFVRPLISPTVCASGAPLTLTNIEIKKLADSETIFNLSDWTGLPSYFVDAISGALTSSPY
ncbi:cyanophycinase [Variovorax sp. J22R115]|uniref:cyanophycinase n=1 Tax=Variovorax sp. J22R115 TaxID=3053509 RepID=UPI0025775AF1|nr:cyanophycinase [Variovorax sp. J22R115]MDM0047710.1 cyanophycinase [Variovorax sp. J22R115]